MDLSGLQITSNMQSVNSAWKHRLKSFVERGKLVVSFVVSFRRILPPRAINSPR